MGGTLTIKELYYGTEYSDSEALPDGYSWTMLNIGLLGKYPIPLANMVFWPAAGILYSMTLSLDIDGDGEAEDLSDFGLNDLFLSIGCGIDIPISAQFFLTGYTLFHLNLTPAKTADNVLPANQTVTVYRITAYAGGGFTF